MNYRFEPISNKKTWDDFLFSNAPSVLFQTWNWGETVRRSGGALLRVGIYLDELLVGVFQVQTVTAKRGTFLHVRHGPVFSSYSSKLWLDFTSYMRELTLREKGLFFRISPLISENNETILVDMGYRSAAIHAMDAEVCWVLSLSPSEEELLAGMRKTTRYEIRKADKLGVRVQQTTSGEDLKVFLRMYNQTAKRHGFVSHTGVNEEFEIFSRDNEASVYIATHENRPVAGAIILFVGNQAIYHHGASISTSIPGSYAIQWQAIQEAKRRGKIEYNFWGVAPTEKHDHPWAGLTLFKKGFGGEERRYLHAHDYPVSKLYIVTNTIERLRKIRRGY